MNMLNSILIEGKVVSVKSEDSSRITFLIETERKVRSADGSDIISKIFTFTVRAFGNNAESVHKWANVGREVRIVGRLEQYGTETYIVAEHIEYKFTESYRGYKE